MLFQSQLNNIKESLIEGIDEKEICAQVANDYLETHCTKIRVCYDCGDDRSYCDYEYSEDSSNEAVDAAKWGIEEVKKLLTLN